MTQKTRLSVVAVAPQSAPGRGQMSHANDFARRLPPTGGRGRAVALRGVVRRHRGGPGVGPVSRMAALAAWAEFLRVTFATREVVAVEFDVTFQTACNWRAGTSQAQLNHVLQAARDYPGAFAAMVGAL